MIHGISKKCYQRSIVKTSVTLVCLSNKHGAASMAGRRITVLRQAGAACDHPIDPSYPEGAYLTNILLRVS
ncbi:hypothetical protein glysoja_007226 [Glycine soja]|nr:hypothetical protein glysoja_007226 [Glycine soja]